MAKLRSFKAGMAVTLEFQGMWRRFECTVEVEPDEGEDTALVKERAWRTVDYELEQRVREAQVSFAAEGVNKDDGPK